MALTPAIEAWRRSQRLSFLKGEYDPVDIVSCELLESGVVSQDELDARYPNFDWEKLAPLKRIYDAIDDVSWETPARAAWESLQATSKFQAKMARDDAERKPDSEDLN